jgi:hypothetical protein
LLKIDKPRTSFAQSRILFLYGLEYSLNPYEISGTIVELLEIFLILRDSNMFKIGEGSWNPMLAEDKLLTVCLTPC